MTLTCTRYKCGTPADVIIVYGCINSHLNETWLCDHHLVRWTPQHHHCLICDQPFIDAEIISIDYVTIINPGILQELDQELDHA